jgi:Cathepsin propeptide inhibitor domain (I29)
MRKGFAALAVVGIAAVVAVFALTNSVGKDGAIELNQFSDSSFNRYMAKHGKSYATKEEYIRRKEIHDRALEEVVEHNQQPGQTWFKAINKFSDMTPDERKKYTGALD